MTMMRTKTEPSPALPGVSTNRSWRGWWLFLVIGLLGYALLTFGVYALHEWGGVDERPAYALMIVLVMAGNFFANRRVVFPAGRTGEPARQAIRFLGAALTFRVVEFLLFSLFIGPLAIHYIAAIALTSALSYFGKYYVFARWVFR